MIVAAAAIAASVILAALVSYGPSTDDRARTIEPQLRCPTCQGLSISGSPATSATQMRALVREHLAGGASDDQVLDQPDALLYRAVARLRLAGSLTDGVRRDVERYLQVASSSDPRRAMATSLLEPSPPASGNP